MFKTFGKTLLILIATMMVADPLMACCFPASLESATTASVSILPEADKPPCHGTTISASSSDSVKADSNCPGCGDCNSKMSAVEHVETPALASSIADFELDAVSIASTGIVANRISTVLTIPNRFLPRSVTTPVTLKQKLHI